MIFKRIVLFSLVFVLVTIPESGVSRLRKPKNLIKLQVHYGDVKNKFVLFEHRNYFRLSYSTNHPLEPQKRKRLKLSKKIGSVINKKLARLKRTRKRDCERTKIEALFRNHRGKAERRSACLTIPTRNRDELIKITNLLAGYVQSNR